MWQVSAIGVSTATDDQLVKDLDHDCNALMELYRRYGSASYGLAKYIVGDAALAEEVVQDAFVRVWRGQESYQSSGQFRGWLLTITRRLAIDAWRRQRREGALSAWAADLSSFRSDAQNPEQLIVAKDTAHQVRDALCSLPQEQRLVLEAVYFKGLSQPEVARELEIPLGTVKSRLRLAVARLKAVLEVDAP